MKFDLDEALGLNEGIKMNKLSREMIEDSIWEILDNCITHSIADEFYQTTGLDPEFDSLDEFSDEQLQNMLTILDDQGYNDEQFYIDREAGIDWEPNKYHKIYENAESKECEKAETMTTIETDSNAIKTWKLDSVKHMNESADEDWIYLFPELTEEDKKALEDYDLKFLGRNYFEGEVNEVIAGTRGDLERYARHYLDYVLHPLYLYEPGMFAGEIVPVDKLEESKADIYADAEDEYFSALKKAEDDGIVTFSVKLSEDDEDPVEFDSFEEAKKYAIEHNIDKVHVSSFAHCWGYYCDGEYDEYDETDLDVNKNIVEAMKVCCICGKEFSGHGNNAEPVTEGQCCDECNLETVIPARVRKMTFEDLGIENLPEEISNDEPYVEDVVLEDKDTSRPDILKAVREWARGDFNVGHIMDIDDFHEFCEILAYDYPEIEGHADECKKFWDEYWEEIYKARAESFDENLNESEDKNEYIIKYAKYYTERFYETTFKAKSDFAAIIKVDDKCGMGQLKEMQKSPEDYEPEELEALENEDTALEYLSDNNGIGCDDILFFKNLTTGKVLIGEEGEEDNWDDDEDLDEKLIQGKSDATLKKNIKTEIEAGKDPKQAYAIAKSIQKKNMKEDLDNDEIDDFFQSLTDKDELYFVTEDENGNEGETFFDLQDAIDYVNQSETSDTKVIAFVNINGNGFERKSVTVYECDNFNESLESNRVVKSAKNVIDKLENIRDASLEVGDVGALKKLHKDIEKLLDSDKDKMNEDIPVDANEDEPYLDLSQEIEYEDGNELPEVDLKFSEYVDDEPVIDYENENFNEHLETAKTEEEKKQIEAEIKETEKEIDHAEDHNDPDKAIELHTHLDMLQEDSEPVIDYINENIKANPEEAQAVNLDEVK